jgi:ABC-type amino acid transport substrate-binding protein
MSGIPVTTLRASRMLFSQSYLDETFALVVRDHDREAFSTWTAIRERPETIVAVPDLPYYIDKVRERLPNARLQVVRDAAAVFAPDARPVDAIVMPAERGSAWTLLHPQYAVVVPEPGIVKVPLAYPICGRDEAFASFLNTWIDLKRKDGTLDQLYAYWVLGRNAAPPARRWSIIRDVLHWVD